MTFHLTTGEGDLALQAFLLDQDFVAFQANEGVVDAGEGAVRRDRLADVDTDLLHAAGDLCHQADFGLGAGEASEVQGAQRRQGGDKPWVRGLGRAGGDRPTAKKGDEEGQ